MENLKTEKTGEITDMLLIALYQNYPEIDSRIDFFKRGINADRFSEEVQRRFGQRVVSFQKDLDTLAIISGVDIDTNIHNIPISDENEDIYEASINPYELLDEEDNDLKCLI